MSLFEAQNISVRFGGIRAVDDVSFDVQKGEVFSIIGPNGAGKTTIFNLISRIYNSTEGKLIFDGQDVTKTPPFLVAGLGDCPHVPEHRAVSKRVAASEFVDWAALSFAGWTVLPVGVPAVDTTGRNPAPGTRRGCDCFSGTTTLPRLADRQSALRRAQGGRTRPRALH